MASKLGFQEAHIDEPGISEGGQPLELGKIKIHIAGEAAVEEHSVSGKLAVSKTCVLVELGAEK